MDITQAVSSNILEKWLNRDYLDIKKLEKLRKSFQKQKPFPNLELNDFIKEEKAVLLLKELSKEKFFPKESDLFKFKQTNDFISADGKILKEFRSLLMSKEFISLISYVTNEKLTGNVDVNGSLYENTDHLLPHDDRLEDRKVAFIYYLSTSSKKDGGALLLFSSKKGDPIKAIKSINPSANTFAFFKVSPISFHQVEEVLSKKQRITINGWFHGNK